MTLLLALPQVPCGRVQCRQAAARSQEHSGKQARERVAGSYARPRGVSGHLLSGVPQAYAVYTAGALYSTETFVLCDLEKAHASLFTYALVKRALNGPHHICVMDCVWHAER